MKTMLIKILKKIHKAKKKGLKSTTCSSSIDNDTYASLEKLGYKLSTTMEEWRYYTLRWK